MPHVVQCDNKVQEKVEPIIHWERPHSAPHGCDTMYEMFNQGLDVNHLDAWSVECTWVDMSRWGCSWDLHCALPNWALRVLLISTDEPDRTREGGSVFIVVADKVSMRNCDRLRS
jgi:hypothetical protein